MNSNERILPAYPLFVKDPNFSFWTNSEQLNTSNAETWYGEKKKIYGFIKADGKTYCFLGKASDFAPCGVEAAKQLSVSVTAFSTDYVFLAGQTTLKIRFVSPLPPTDVELLSMPVCYMEYKTEGGNASEISLFVNRDVAYNEIGEHTDRRVGGGVTTECFGDKQTGETAFFGLKRQLPLSNNDDAIGADWGYWYLSGDKAYILDEVDLTGYLCGKCARDERGDYAFLNAGEERFIGAVNGVNGGVEGAFAFACDDVVSINYFGDFRKGYYLENHTIAEGIRYIRENRALVNEKLAAFDADLKKRAEKYGADYLSVLYASLRQSVAAHKLIADRDGKLLFLSKECCSNGCIATVDVSYPSMPLYLLYNPELVKGMMRPILRFAKMPVWNYDFAPHDAGTYPSCCGQVYGLKEDREEKFRSDKEAVRYHGNYAKKGWIQTHFPIYSLPASFNAYDFDLQMPVEECANLLVMFLACYRADKDLSFFEGELPLAEKWVRYLVEYGLKPENQLCTDDFAGHLKNNINLAIKATVGVAAYAELVGAAGKAEESARYRKIAEKFAAEITRFAEKFPHLPITWDSDESTFSLKYNFAFDKLLSLGLFPYSLFEREIDCYLEKSNRYGTPLDSRKAYTKSDWLMWAACLTDDVDKKKKMIASLAAFLKESPDRVPFGDWYETEGGEHHYFRARSVQGGCFILLLE